MHNKIFFLLKTFICIGLLTISSRSAISQHYIGFTIEDLIVIKGNNYTVKNYTGKKGALVYDLPSRMIWGKETNSDIEIFFFDSDNKINGSDRVGLFSEEEVMKIVRYNNENYKKVNVGQKQGFLQWLDVKNSISLQLGVTSGADKFYFGSYTTNKE